MLSSYGIPLICHKRGEKISNDSFNGEPYLKRPQMTTTNLKSLKLLNPNQMQTLPLAAQLLKSKIKGGENIENNENYLDENFHYNDNL